MFTGLSAFSTTVFDFGVYRFLTGLGVGAVFAVAVSLVAETVPPAARPYALGLLQMSSALGNMTAATVSIVLGYMQIDGPARRLQAVEDHVPDRDYSGL